MQKEKSNNNMPVRAEVGTYDFRLTGAEIKDGSKPNTEILHLTLNIVKGNGDVDTAYKPFKVFLGVKHPSKKYLDISASQADVLLEKLGVEEGLAKFNGDISVLSTMEFKKEHSFTIVKLDVYEEEQEKSFTAPDGRVVSFKERKVSLRENKAAS